MSIQWGESSRRFFRQTMEDRRRPLTGQPVSLRVEVERPRCRNVAVFFVFLPNLIDPVGEYEPNGYGLYDMGGNKKRELAFWVDV